MELGDGTHTIFLNACGTMDDVSPKLKAFLDFVKGISSDDPFVRKLENRVREAKQNPDWRREFMTLSMLMQDEREEGFEQGRAEGRTEGIFKTLAGLIRKGLLSLRDAASEVNMTEAEFTARMAALGV